jgi:hypothetical protein
VWRCSTFCTGPANAGIMSYNILVANNSNLLLNLNLNLNLLLNLLLNLNLNLNLLLNLLLNLNLNLNLPLPPARGSALQVLLFPLKI